MSAYFFFLTNTCVCIFFYLSVVAHVVLKTSHSTYWQVFVLTSESNDKTLFVGDMYKEFQPHLRIIHSSVFLILRKINILQSLLIRCVAVGRIKYKINSWNSYTTKTKTREAPVYVAHVKKEIMIRYMDIYASLKLRHLFIKLWSPIKKILSHKNKK